VGEGVGIWDGADGKEVGGSEGAEVGIVEGFLVAAIVDIELMLITGVGMLVMRSDAKPSEFKAVFTLDTNSVGEDQVVSVKSIKMSNVTIHV
jgi:hypothetical protein